MKSLLAIFLFALLCLSCGAPKSDVALFDEGRLRINLSADVARGFEPLLVNFSAYLENDERTVDHDIEEIKWIIRGPNGFEQEIIQESYNYQDEEANKENFFHLEYDFRRYGLYTVRIVLNKGTFASVPVKVQVMEDLNRR